MAVGDWIAQQIPWDKHTVYVEPFAGMLGILLRRAPVRCEIINDSDNRIVDYWLAVRDHAEALQWGIELTPQSRVEFERCIDRVDDAELPIYERARCLHAILMQSMGSANMCVKSNWSRTGTARRNVFNISPLCERLKDVQIDKVDAAKLLKWTADKTDAVVYCDPPYQDVANTKPYKEGYEHAAMIEALKHQKGRVAISGYADQWDELGWDRRELVTRTQATHTVTNKISARTEVLWANFAVDGQESLF